MPDRAADPGNLRSRVHRIIWDRIDRLPRLWLILASGVALALLVAVALDWPRLLSATLGLLGVLLLLAVVELWHQFGKEIRTAEARSERLTAGVERTQRLLETAERQILAAIEDERSAVAEREGHCLALSEQQQNLIALVEQNRALIAGLNKDRAADDVKIRETVDRIETVKGDVAESIRAISVKVDEAQDALITEQRRLQLNTASIQRNQTCEVEALLQLFQGFKPRAPMPSSGGGWALNPTGILQILHVVARYRPKLVLELGSGASSVWIAYALEQHGGRLVSLDHEAEYAEQTRSQVSLHGLDGVADIRLAPLRNIIIESGSYQWYDLTAVNDLHQIDLLIVDGPPGRLGPAARYPALPLLEPRLASSALIVLDDVDRADEREIMNRWITTIGGVRQERSTFGRQAYLAYSRRGSSGD